MADPSTIHQFVGIIRGLLILIFVGVCVTWMIELSYVFEGSWFPLPRRPPEGTIPGLFELDRQQFDPRENVIVELFSGGIALMAGLSTYLLLGIIILGIIFFGTLFTGGHPPTWDMLYLAAGAGVIISVVTQSKVRSCLQNLNHQ